MKQLRYTGEFQSRSGIVWRVDILQESAAAFPKSRPLEFPADSPLVIEWGREDKEKVICGSTATLKLLSPYDRAYQDLYTVEVGRIRLDIYRADELYWSGTLDSEFYEEPYERLRNYEVSLTFSDFGILDRLRYGLQGTQTIQAVVLHALQASGVHYTSLDDSSFVSSRLMSAGPFSITTDLSVRSDNFVDEDGQVASLYDVVEGALQPLALRMVQRFGKVYLYDLNALHRRETPERIVWEGDSQTMGTDRVANNVRVIFSPYSNATLLSDEISYRGEHLPDMTNLAAGVGNVDLLDYYSYKVNYNRDWDNNPTDFTIFLSDKSAGIRSIGEGCRFFYVQPVFGSGAEGAGVAYAFCTGGHGPLSSGWPQWRLHRGVPTASLSGNPEILTTYKSFLPDMGETDALRYFIRVTEEIMLDARYNPFTPPGEHNEGGNAQALRLCSSFVFIPVRITLYDDAGNPIMHYRNRHTAEGAEVGNLSYSKGVWVDGPDPGGDCWLEYYNPDNLATDAGIGGWKANRHCIGRPDGHHGRIGTKIYREFAKIPSGEYLPYPPRGGNIEVQIQSGVIGNGYGQWLAVDGFRSEREFGNTRSQWHDLEIYGKLRWCLYKAPKVEVVRRNIVLSPESLDDVEYSGVLDPAAREEISIDTTCGTALSPSPTARGIYLSSRTGQPVQKIYRDDYHDHPEQLLIGTLYSQFATRKTTLRGEANIHGGLHSYTDAHQPGKRFMLMSDAQDLIADTTEAEYCEFRPDEYTPKNL